MDATGEEGPYVDCTAEMVWWCLKMRIFSAPVDTAMLIVACSGTTDESCLQSMHSFFMLLETCEISLELRGMPCGIFKKRRRPALCSEALT